MDRRDFMMYAGSWIAPLSAAAQNAAAKEYRIGPLNSAGPADKSPYGPLLAQHGYVLDQNITFVHHGVEMQLNRLPHLVDELQASKVDVVLPGKSRPDSGTTLYVGAKRSIFDLLDASAVASVEHHALTDAGIGDGLAVSY